MTTTNAAAQILEICIKEAAIKLSNIAADRGVCVNETGILSAVETDPEGNTARQFKTLFLAGLKAAREVVAA